MTFRTQKLLFLLITFFLNQISYSNDKLAKEIVQIQRQYLGAIVVPNGVDKLDDDESREELERRVSLVIANWEYQKKGEEDAKKNGLSVVTPPNQSDLDKAFIKALNEKHNFKLFKIPEGLTVDQALFYTYGYNRYQLLTIEKQHKEINLGAIFIDSSPDLLESGYGCSSLLFVPWRFSGEFTPSFFKND